MSEIKNFNNPEYETPEHADNEAGQEFLESNTESVEGGPPEYVRWDKTVVMERRLQDDPFFEELEVSDNVVEKFYRGRPIIHRDSAIQGGVYLGQGAREAIVVDEKYGGLAPLYLDLIKRRESRIQQGEAKSFRDGVLAEVWSMVQEVMPYSNATVKQIAEEFQLEGDQKVKLDHYIERHGGVCRHQALLAGWLLEKAIGEGRLRGKVSIDRNSISGIGGHAWVRYNNHAGDVYILDPAQKYFGPLKSVGEKDRWFYERPEDLVDNEVK